MRYFIKCLKLYADSSGRARRAEYWNFTLFNFIFAIFISIIAEALNAPILSGIFTLVMFLPGFTAGMRRMHDVGKSGWFFLIPLYNLILAVTPGNSGPNEYGLDPKDTDNAILTSPETY